MLQFLRLYIHILIPYIIRHMVFLYHFKKASEYYQEIPQSNTADQPTAS